MSYASKVLERQDDHTLLREHRACTGSQASYSSWKGYNRGRTDRQSWTRNPVAPIGQDTTGYIYPTAAETKYGPLFVVALLKEFATEFMATAVGVTIAP